MAEMRAVQLTRANGPFELVERGARGGLATVTSAKAISAVVDGRGADDKLVAVGTSAEPIAVSSLPLIPGRRSIQGWPSGDRNRAQAALSRSSGARRSTRSDKTRFRMVPTVPR